MGASNDNVPALEYGVGGTQSMVDIVTNETLSDVQKQNILTEWFGIDESKAKKMLETI